MFESLPIRIHEDPDLFLPAVNFTSAATGFSPVLIEKDYYCTVLLRHLVTRENRLVFKGGTCLAKVHTAFFRLSEDLDFTIPIEEDATRKQRSARVSGTKAALDGLDQPGWRVVSALRGADSCRQYTAQVAYPSLFGQQTIQVDVSLREPLLDQIIEGEARTLLLHPEGWVLVPAVQVPCLSFRETMAEKMRAALSRREPAIRDFYDLDHAVQKRGFDPQEGEMVGLPRQKLAAVSDPVDVSPAKFAALEFQVEARLRAVARTADFESFDLARAFQTAVRLATALACPA